MLSVFCIENASSAATDLKLNPELDYNSDSDDGPLITGKEMSGGKITVGKPAYIIFYQRECYNSKRQAKRTVRLYKRYSDRVDFIVIDLDSKMSGEQKNMVNRYYDGYIPHLTILNRQGKAVYDNSGEANEKKLSELLDRILQ